MSDKFEIREFRLAANLLSLSMKDLANLLRVMAKEIEENGHMQESGGGRYGQYEYKVETQSRSVQLPLEPPSDTPEAREPGCTCYAHQWGWHADNCPLYDETLLP